MSSPESQKGKGLKKKEKKKRLIGLSSSHGMERNLPVGSRRKDRLETGALNHLRVRSRSEGGGQGTPEFIGGGKDYVRKGGEGSL